MTPISLVLATPADYEAVCAYVAMYYAYDGIAFDATVRDGIRLLLENPSYGAAYFIEFDGERIGYCVLTYGFDHEIGGREGWINDFFLDEPHRGKGLGKAALEGILQQMAGEGLRLANLVVLDGNERARRLYEAPVSGLPTEPR